MISPIAISTEGWISPSTKRGLSLATVGWIIITGVIAPEIEDRVIFTKGIEGEIQVTESSGGRLAIARRDDEDLLFIINMWLRCRK